MASETTGAVLIPGKIEVVVEASAHKHALSTWFAAEEMTNFLSRVLGASVPIVSETSRDRTSIVLGTNTWSVAAGIDLNGIPRDGFAMRTYEGDIYIAGTDEPGFDIRKAKASLNIQHGTLNGVYDFLERFVGCRFYFPGELGEVVPVRPRIEVPELNRREGPDYSIRESTRSLGEWPVEFTEREKAIAGQLFLLRLRYGTWKIPCCHGQSRSGFCRRFGKTHPEYFRLTEDGTRHLANPDKVKEPDNRKYTSVCMSSRIWDEIYADAKSYFKGEGPEVRGMLVQGGRRFEWGSQARYGEYYDVMPNDGMLKCSCEACQAAYAKARDPLNYATELIWGKVAVLGNRLKAEGVPGTLTMMAYTPYRNVPEVEIPDNIAVMVCNNGPWMRGRQQANAMDNLRRWFEKCRGKVWLWHNTGRYGAMVQKSAGVPSPTPRAFGRHYRAIAPYAFGAYCSNNSPRFLYSAMNYYAFYRVAWDNRTDVDAMVDEYYRLMFGAAERPMGEFLDMLEEKWMNEVMGNVEDTPIGMMAIAPSEFRFWSEIYQLGFVRRLEKLIAEAERLVMPGSIESRRVALFKREFLQPMVPRAEQYDGAGSVCREKERRAANPRPSCVDGFRPVSIEVTEAMTNQINHKIRFPVSLLPGHRYHLSYFVRCNGVKPLHSWGGVGAVVWSDERKDRTLLVLGSGLCGTFDWICQQGEFEVPADIPQEDFHPRLDVRVSRSVGKAEFDGLLLEDITGKR